MEPQFIDDLSEFLVRHKRDLYSTNDYKNYLNVWFDDKKPLVKKQAVGLIDGQIKELAKICSTDKVFDYEKLIRGFIESQEINVFKLLEPDWTVMHKGVASYVLKGQTRSPTGESLGDVVLCRYKRPLELANYYTHKETGIEYKKVSVQKMDFQGTLYDCITLNHIGTEHNFVYTLEALHEQFIDNLKGTIYD